MNGLIIFNNSNDVVFQIFNADLASKIHEIAVQQGLLLETEQNIKSIDGNVVLQIFSPLINSQRIMQCQFLNMYSSFECENGLNFAFGELLGYTFIKIGQQESSLLKRFLGVAKAFVHYLYGANLFAKEATSQQEQLLSQCIQIYEEQLYKKEQALLLEALPLLSINKELKAMVEKSLKGALLHLQTLNYQRAHVLMFIQQKFVACSSSKSAVPLASSDLLFLYVLSQALNQNAKTLINRSIAVFLRGSKEHTQSGCIPCIAHFTQLEKGVLLVQIVEYANLQVCSYMYDTCFVLQQLLKSQLESDSDALRTNYDQLEMYVKQTLEALKRAKLKGEQLEVCLKKLTNKWEQLRRMYLELLKHYDAELLLRVESNLPAFIEELKQLFTITCCDSSAINLEQLPEVAAVLEGKLLEYIEFLSVKAERNINMAAYLEDFPGLIHFMYINRKTGLMIAPDLRQQTLLPQDHLWNMVEFSRSYLKRGQSLIMWKDRTFHYSYFLWFADQTHSTLKLTKLKTNTKISAEPGLLAHDYYQQLAELSFPKVIPSKIKCYEVFCVHIGLVTPSCVLEHARRLVATIADLVGEDF